MPQHPIPPERASQQVAWYDNQVFDVGSRVVIDDPAERAAVGAGAGRVVGYEASGPRKGEPFIRVLVQPDLPAPTIVALSPQSLSPEPGAELAGIARTLLTSLQQSLRPDQFSDLVAWLSGPQAAALAADPATRRQRLRLGGLYLPGLVLPELIELAIRIQK